MPNYQRYKLGEICSDVSYGYTESAKREKIGPKFLRITDIQNDHINWGAVPYCPIKESDYKKYKLEIGDIVIARTGNSTGATATIKHNIEAVFASYLIRFRLQKDIANPFYVDFVLRSTLWKNFIESIKGGSAQPGANAKQLSEFEFEIPDLATQTRIASILSALDDKIELNRRMNHTLEQMAQTLFKKYFVDDIDPDNLPEGWRWGTIGDIYKTTSGGTPSRSKNEYFENGHISWVKSKELNGGFILETEEKITADALKNSSAKLLPAYSVLVAMYGATVGEIATLSIEATCNQAICAILPNKEYPYSFVFQFLKLNKEELINRATGSAQQNISQLLIQNFEFVIPPTSIIKGYDELAKKLFWKIENNLKEIKSLSNIRDSLLPKLMSGEIEVS